MRAGPVSPGAGLSENALLFAVILSAVLAANGLLEIWLSYREQNALLVRIQQEQAGRSID